MTSNEQFYLFHSSPQLSSVSSCSFMISHAFNSASILLQTEPSSEPPVCFQALFAFPKLDKPSSTSEIGSSPTGVQRKETLNFHKSHRKET